MVLSHILRLVVGVVVLHSVLVQVAAGQDSKKLLDFNPKYKEEFLRQIGLTTEYRAVELSEEIGIAVIDDDFGNVKENGRAFPVNYEFVNQYDEEFKKRHQLSLDPSDYPSLENFKPAPAPPADENAAFAAKNTPHGLLLVQSVLAVVGRLSPVKFYLLNGNYGANFLAATYYAEELFRAGKIKTVVNSSTFAMFGVGNGKGPIDVAVSAVAGRNPGLKWFNSAGNDGEHVWAGKAKRGKNSAYLEFRPGEKKSDCLQFRSRSNNNNVKVKLSYDGRLKSLYSGTKIDYDLEVISPRGRVYTGAMVQVAQGESAVPQPPAPGGEGSSDDFRSRLAPNESISPYEEVLLRNIEETEEGGWYCVRVKAMSDETRETDDIQINVTGVPSSDSSDADIGNSVFFKDHNRTNEMYPPATAEGVISVGSIDSYSSIGKRNDGTILPTIVTKADRVDLNDGRYHEGSSFSAPIAAGLGLLVEGLYPDSTSEELAEALYPETANIGEVPRTLLQADPGRVTLDYVREHRRNGHEMIRMLLQLTGLRETDVDAYLYPDGTMVVTLPNFPPVYGKLNMMTEKFYRQERNHLHEYDYYFSLRRNEQVTSAAVAFSYFRPKPAANSADPDATLPWKVKQNRAVPYDITNIRRVDFEAEDFLILQREADFEYDPQDYTPLEVAIRQGEATSTPRYRYLKLPAREQLRRVMGQ